MAMTLEFHTVQFDHIFSNGARSQDGIFASESEGKRKDREIQFEKDALNFHNKAWVWATMLTQNRTTTRQRPMTQGNRTIFFLDSDHRGKSNARETACERAREDMKRIKAFSEK